MRDEDVEHEASDHRGDAERGPPAQHPVGQRDPRRAWRARHNEKRPAEAEAGGDQSGKPGRAEALTYIAGYPLDMPGGGSGGERDSAAPVNASLTFIWPAPPPSARRRGSCPIQP